MMKAYRFEWISGAVLALLVAVFCAWQAPSRPLTATEVDAYMLRIQNQLPLPADEKRAFLAHMRAWAMADDGRPVHMLNLMRYYPQVRPLPEMKGYAGTPEQANRHYEDKVMPLLFERGGYPVFAGGMQGVALAGQPNTNLVTYDGAVDNWSRVIVVRYPSRRAFMSLLSDPAYAKFMPYKVAALTLVLAPMHSEVVMPDVRLVLGGAALGLWLAAGWWRAMRRGRPRAARHANCAAAGVSRYRQFQ